LVQTPEFAQPRPLRLSVGRVPTQYAVYFTDVLTRVYAVDAQTGKLLWKTKAGEHPRAKSSNGPAVADGKVFVGFSSMETTTGAVSTYECCSFRGHVVALDANTGKKLWTRFVIDEEPKPRGKNAQGVTLYGPSGGSVWNVPTIDSQKKAALCRNRQTLTPFRRRTEPIQFSPLRWIPARWHGITRK
jgi:polyvinyl alcohol dehydrogenase (cytochrome)